MAKELVNAPEVQPWEEVSLTKEEWEALTIPEFLRRTSVPPTPAPVEPQPVPTKKYREELETKIKVEADKRWRNWVPTKTDRKRPRLSTYVKQVRKEFAA